MTDRTAENRKDSKRPYRKPEFVRISLRPEEAVLGSCKSAASGGPLQRRCNGVGACRSVGS